jgi:DNA ligase-1
MRAFARLLDRLAFTASRNAKLRLVRDFLAETPDPDRGWALAALTGTLVFSAAKPARSARRSRRGWIRCCSAWSYDYVGDLAETVALVWPAEPGANREPDAVGGGRRLAQATRAEVQPLIEAGWTRWSPTAAGRCSSW